MVNKITLVKSTYILDADGKQVTRYTPVLKSDDPTFSGELSFSFWEVYTDDSDDMHRFAIKSATANACDVLTSIIQASN